MSLVNDMLRDLDQRRKSNETSHSTYGLTHVDDSVQRWKLNQLVLIAVLAALLVLAFAFYYFQVYQAEEVTRQLDLRPALTGNAPLVESGFIEAGEREIDLEQIEPLLAPQAESTSLQLQQQAPGNSLATAVTPVQGDNGAGNRPAISSPETSIAVDVSNTAVSPQQPRLSTSATQAGTAAIARVENLSVPQPPVTSVIENLAPEAAANGSRDGSANVRNPSQLTPQERDTLNVQDALALFNSNQITAAFMKLSSYIDSNRDAHQSRETYAKLLMSQGQASEAMAIVNSGLALSPNYSGYKKIKARLLMTNNQAQDAAQILVSRAPSLVTDVEYHELLATAQLAARDYGNAIVIYTSLIRHDNRQGKWWYGIAAAYDAQGDSDSARQAYAQAIQTANLSASLRQRAQRRVEELR